MLFNSQDIYLKESRMRLRENAFKYWEIIENSQIGIVLTDSDGNVFENNNAASEISKSGEKVLDTPNMPIFLSKYNVPKTFSNTAIKDKNGVLLMHLILISNINTPKLKVKCIKNLNILKKNLRSLARELSNSFMYPAFININPNGEGDISLGEHELNQWISLISDYEKRLCHASQPHAPEFLSQKNNQLVA